MKKVSDENIKRQLEKSMKFFLKYFPIRIKNVDEDAIEARKLIWGFKDANCEAQEKVAQMIADYLREEYGKRTKDIIFACVPACTQEQNQKRYEKFCERVNELSGIKNGFPHITVSGNRLAIHEHRHDKEKIVSQQGAGNRLR